MEDVVIITRDINGSRTSHYLKWDKVCNYVGEGYFSNEEDEILLVVIDGVCVYSGLTSTAITWEDVIGFFA